MLVVQSPGSGVDAVLVDPLLRHASAIRRRHGVLIQVEASRDPTQAFDGLRDASGDLLFVQGREILKRARADVVALLAELRGRVGRLIWMDSHDSASREDFWVAGEVDLTLRRSLVRSCAAYGRPWLQGRLHAEAVRRRWHPAKGRRWRAARLVGGPCPRRALLSVARIWHSALAPGRYVWAGNRFPVAAGAVAVGWNLGLADRFAHPAEDAERSEARRDVDVACRVRVASPGLPAWYTLDRLEAIHAVRGLAPRWIVVADAAHRPRDQYLAELRRSRLVVSPFGWGEICFRDFEAILAGALLVKPSMRHLETWPDVYRAHETYVPVRWDWSDLEAACLPYLEDEARRRELAANARKILIESFGERAFLDRLGAIFSRLRADGR
jgi:hypothetical protein